jgi:hypothetical protein
MLLGKVVGTLVATRKEESLEGLKFLVLKQLDVEGKETGGLRLTPSVPAWARSCCMQPAVRHARRSSPTNAHATESSWPSSMCSKWMAGSPTIKLRRNDVG